MSTYSPNVLYHVFNQGNNKQKIFFKQRNYYYFKNLIRKHLLPHADLIAYCLMPNHFHWLLMPKGEACLPSKGVKPSKKIIDVPERSENLLHTRLQNLSLSVGTLLSSYTKAINKQENRTGSLFRKGTKVKSGIISDLITLEGKNSKYFFSADNDYSLTCFNYIHKNPVQAGLAISELDWKFSSAQEYYIGVKNPICNIPLAEKLFDLEFINLK